MRGLCDVKQPSHLMNNKFIKISQLVWTYLSHNLSRDSWRGSVHSCHLPKKFMWLCKNGVILCCTVWFPHNLRSLCVCTLRLSKGILTANVQNRSPYCGWTALKCSSRHSQVDGMKIVQYKLWSNLSRYIIKGGDFKLSKVFSHGYWCLRTPKYHTDVVQVLPNFMHLNFAIGTFIRTPYKSIFIRCSYECHKGPAQEQPWCIAASNKVIYKHWA